MRTLLLFAVAAQAFAGSEIFWDAYRNAQCWMSYGNSTQPGSAHSEDQLPLMVAKKLHPVWRDRAEIEQHLEKRENPQ